MNTYLHRPNQGLSQEIEIKLSNGTDFRSTHSNMHRIADIIILKYVISDKNRTNESHLNIFSVRGQQSVTLMNVIVNVCFDLS